MKPKEFDELIRQKFDRGDFEYNPAGWDQLVDELDGRSKKNRMMMWWWMPLAGVAASVAFAMGIQILMRPATNGTDLANATKTGIYTSASDNALALATSPAATAAQYAAPGAHHTATHSGKQKNNTVAVKESFAINLDAALGNTSKAAAPAFNFNAGAKNAQPKDKKKQPIAENIVATFKPQEETKKPAKLFIILSGGVNRGAQSNGYMAGATIRKMINDKVFIESDVAFASSANTQATEYLVSSTAATAAKAGPVAKSTAESSKVAVPVSSGIIKTQDISYNLSYAQVTPSLGVKIMKRMSIAAGPDFEKVLADNRPATSTVDRDNLQVVPLFDIGFMGKSEYTITKWVKAGISYRKSINNVITPTNKYIDRDYLQFQLKCAIFNK